LIQRNVELGYGTVTKEAMQDRELTIEAKAIYAYLCSFAGGKDKAWPAVSKMCYDLKISKDRFYKHMQLLLDNDYISKKRVHYTDTGTWANNRYFIEK